MPGSPEAAGLDLRLVPAALTSWAVTAAGILWDQAGSLIAIAVSVATTAAAGWWGNRGRTADQRALAAGVSAVLLVGGGFAVAVTLRVDEVRHHAVSGHLGEVTAVVVAPTETPRVLAGARMMFRGSLLELDGAQSSGKVMVFASGAGYSRLTAGQPAAFRARITMPKRRDLTVAVLTANGEPTLGDAAPIHRAAHHIRDRFAQASRMVLPADQAAHASRARSRRHVDGAGADDAGLPHVGSGASDRGVGGQCDDRLRRGAVDRDADRPAGGRRAGRCDAVGVRRGGAAVAQRAARRRDGRDHAAGGAVASAAAGDARARGDCRGPDGRCAPNSLSTSGSRSRCRPPRRWC